jgi:hypothetical protein
MNDKDKKAFEQWELDVEWSTAFKDQRLATLEAWQAACDYKDKEIDILKNHDIAGYQEGIDCLQADNAKLKKALRFTILAAEQQYQPNRPLEKGLCPTFYFTLSYEGDLELIEETKRARQVLDELDKE